MKPKLICVLSSIIGILMIYTGLVLSDATEVSGLDNLSIEEFNIKNLATSSKNVSKSIEEDNSYNDLLLDEVSMNTAPSGVYRVEVYDGLTMEELADKLNRSLAAEISGKGYVIASKCIELGVDPYMATAIMLQETGCKWTCSDLVKACNNVGGQKGYGCGSYSYFNTIDEGIEAMISNLYYNYYSRGLTTPETINPVYAESQSWSYNVNRYIDEIRNN